MKLIIEVTDVNELNSLRILFDSNGIPIFVANEDAARNAGFLYPARNYAIHVVFDEQYHDALMLMKDESHIVENQIDIETYKQYLDDNKPLTLAYLLKNTLLITTAVFAIATTGLWLIFGR